VGGFDSQANVYAGSSGSWMLTSQCHGRRSR
jgi:hypothetical protein